MVEIFVLVAATADDMKAEGIAAAVAQRPDMILVGQRVARIEEIADLLQTLPVATHCGLVLVGPREETRGLASKWVESRDNLVALRVDILDDIVRIAARGVGLNPVLSALRELVERAASVARDRTSHLELHPSQNASLPQQRPLFTAATSWINAVLRIAVARHASGQGDFPGLTVVTSTVAESLDPGSARVAAASVADAEHSGAALTRALGEASDAAEPLAAIARRLLLSDLEFRLLLLTIGPELDTRYQRCIGLMMDDLSRRLGTLGLYAGLLGEAADICRQLACAGSLVRWRLLEVTQGGLGHADEPLRVDLPLLGFILGAPDALSRDARIRPVLRLAPWIGARLLDEAADAACGLIRGLQARTESQWIVFAGDSPLTWLASLERGAADLGVSAVRVDLSRIGGTDLVEVEDIAIRLARMALLTGGPLIVDATASDDQRERDEALRTFFSVIARTGISAAIITRRAAGVVRLLGSASCKVETTLPSAADPGNATRMAAAGAGCPVGHQTAREIASRHPLRIDQLEQAMCLARAKSTVARPDLFIAACREVSAESTSHLAEWIEPLFELQDVVLPPDRKSQLEEIVDNVRLAPTVLDDWKFRQQLPYGRGVTALFHGPSGTGKTMAALGIARALDVQVLRIDLSRIVSKYIGDTEKNIDRVFAEAQAAGAALLIDEADALLGKRSEVKDAHDRYANIEVAFLLQRMEAYEGLAILTTNLRQNLDAAFLRRLRFIIDFPRPDADAREKIWRKCLPADSHELDDATFRQLARRIDLTGGHVRQITLRAAFVAAAANSKIAIEHIAHATRAELAKLGLPPIELDVTQTRRAA